MTQSGMEQPHTTVWERSYGKRGPAPAHSRNDVADAAIELANEGGLSAVSTRRIAQKLGVSQSALYRYVAGHDEVFDLMVDAAAGEIDLDVALRGEAIDDLTALAARARSVHVRYPWLLDIPVEAMRVGPRGIDFLEYALRAMAVVEVPGPVKLQAIAVLNTLVQQFARAEVGGGTASQERRISQVMYLHKTAAVGDHPYLAAALHISDPGADQPGDMFEPVVRRVLKGVLTSD
ncbi:TetR/AcrR family transcriptional regulator [Rhodococcus sp. ARC_M6]|uniref:TetR/AcrR family transcriptional regulator n=1 Tax=Rhodococcus sp. ARC_M6 TaxID=2928852 RepID=UPI001FB2BC23|nr:TetR/AcrR family transcriptional regulator [Rhodococcus sp. ARC_M6]MCJ0906331.1 TetR/AcrR family transcriptional regulator [Rhodococcus sp. ARC_M6]